MKIFPAIDLIGGKCVRLTQGDYGQVKNYDVDPVQMAKQYAADGAGAIHVVDLDGAKEGRPVNASIVAAIAKAVKVPVQVGGGIRTVQQADTYLKAGVGRVILGTAAIETPDVVRDLVRTEGADRIMISVDHQEGYVATRGWLTSTKVPLTDCILLLRTLKVKWVILTDIARDGMLKSVSPSQGTAVRIFSEDGFQVVAAGGVTTVQDVQQMKEAGATATIVGKALYEGHLTVKECVDVG